VLASRSVRRWLAVGLLFLLTLTGAVPAVGDQSTAIELTSAEAVQQSTGCETGSSQMQWSIGPVAGAAAAALLPAIESATSNRPGPGGMSSNRWSWQESLNGDRTEVGDFALTIRDNAGVSHTVYRRLVVPVLALCASIASGSTWTLSYGVSSCELQGTDRITQSISLVLVGLSGTSFKLDPLPTGWNAGAAVFSSRFITFFRSVGTGVTFPSLAKPFPLVLSFDVTPAGGVAQKQTVTIDPPAFINDACLGPSFTSLVPLTFAGLFADDEASAFASDIDFIASKGIALGCDQLLRRFCPTGSVTRGEMAVFLTRALSLPGASNTFVDDNGSPYESAIASIASAGITLGCSSDGTRFCPNELVTRAQMASFFVRGFKLPEGSANTFVDDDGSVHESDIARLAASGITTGCDAVGPLYCPTDPVSREQMAAFLRRALSLGTS